MTDVYEGLCLVVPWETGEGDLSTLLPSPPVHPDSGVKNVKQQPSLVHKARPSSQPQQEEKPRTLREGRKGGRATVI